MDSGIASYLYSKYAGSMAYIAVESTDGTPGIGSAFHVGEGVFVTARHVVEHKRIVELAMTERTNVRLEGDEATGAQTFIDDGKEKYPVHRVDNGLLQVRQGPFFHPNQKVDVAVFQVAEIDDRTPHVQLGDHLDDWLGAGDFVLTEVIILGYPPIPLTNAPHLVAARAEVNAQVDLREGEHVHFILSSMPRGGFSGGIAVTESEVALGVVTSSLLTNGKESELGFFAVLSVEPIFVCLAEHKMLPACQAEGWDDFWNLDKIADFYDPTQDSDAPLSITVLASIDVFDDGKRFYIEVTCDKDKNLLEKAIASAEHELMECATRRVEVRPGMVKVEICTFSSENSELLVRAADAVSNVFIGVGLVPRRPIPRN